MLAGTVWMVAAVVSAAMAVRSWKHERTAIELFVRVFWIYFAIDLMWSPLLLWAIVRVPALMIVAPIIPAIGVLPFYQRARAKKILADTAAGG